MKQAKLYREENGKLVFVEDTLLPENTLWYQQRGWGRVSNGNSIDDVLDAESLNLIRVDKPICSIGNNGYYLEIKVNSADNYVLNTNTTYPTTLIYIQNRSKIMADNVSITGNKNIKLKVGANVVKTAEPIVKNISNTPLSLFAGGKLNPSVTVQYHGSKSGYNNKKLGDMSDVVLADIWRDSINDMGLEK